MISMQDSFDPYGRPPTFMHSHHSDSPDASPQPYPRIRQDSAPLLMLPAPLAVSGQQSSSVSSSLADAASAFLAPQPDAQPNYRLQRAPDDPSLYEYRDSETSRSERDPILSPMSSEGMISPNNRSMNVLGNDVVVRTAGGASYPGETPNPYRHSQHHVAAYEQMPNFGGYSAEVGDINDQPPLPAMPRSRGVSLVDPGVVINPDGPVRRTRQSKRSSVVVTTSPGSSVATSRYKHQSLPPPTSPTAASSHSAQSQQQQYLPPGAAPPKPQSRGYPQ
jgi:chitin synthase